MSPYGNADAGAGREHDLPRAAERGDQRRTVAGPLRTGRPELSARRRIVRGQRRPAGASARKESLVAQSGERIGARRPPRGHDGREQHTAQDNRHGARERDHVGGAAAHQRDRSTEIRTIYDELDGAGEPVLACFNPHWPNLIFAVA